MTRLNASCWMPWRLTSWPLPWQPWPRSNARMLHFSGNGNCGWSACATTLNEHDDSTIPSNLRTAWWRGHLRRSGKTRCEASSNLSANTRTGAVDNGSRSLTKTATRSWRLRRIYRACGQRPQQQPQIGSNFCGCSLTACCWTTTDWLAHLVPDQLANGSHDRALPRAARAWLFRVCGARRSDAADSRAARHAVDGCSDRTRLGRRGLSHVPWPALQWTDDLCAAQAVGLTHVESDYPQSSALARWYVLGRGRGGTS